MIRNLLALIGLLTVIALIAAGVFIYPKYQAMDPNSKNMLGDFGTRVVKQQESPKDALLDILLKEDEDPQMRALYEGVLQRVMQGENPTDAMLTVMLKDFDPNAKTLYKKMMSDLIKNKSPVDAMVWKVPVQEGITVEEVKDSMKSLASGINLLHVGESPFYKQAEAVTGKPYRHMVFMSFCDVLTGMKMADYNNAFTAMMPCTISVVEHEDGSIWLYSLNVDFMIYGGADLPGDLKESALNVRNKLQRIMEGAANGEF